MTYGVKINQFNANTLDFLSLLVSEPLDLFKTLQVKKVNGFYIKVSSQTHVVTRVIVETDDENYRITAIRRTIEDILSKVHMYYYNEVSLEAIVNEPETIEYTPQNSTHTATIEFPSTLEITKYSEFIAIPKIAYDELLKYKSLYNDLKGTLNNINNQFK